MKFPWGLISEIVGAARKNHHYYDIRLRMTYIRHELSWMLWNRLTAPPTDQSQDRNAKWRHCTYTHLSINSSPLRRRNFLNGKCVIFRARKECAAGKAKIEHRLIPEKMECKNTFKYMAAINWQGRLGENPDKFNLFNITWMKIPFMQIERQNRIQENE